MRKPRSASSLARLLLALLAVAALPCAPALADPPSLATQIADKVRSVLDHSRDAICRIEADDDHGRISGTGFLVDADGTLFTTYSVGGDTEGIVVTLGTEKYPATRLLADPRSGIAILRVDAAKPLPFLKCGTSRALEMATPIIVLGYPLSLPISPSLGIVAGFDIGFEGRYFATRHIRANAAVQRGQSGSPVLNFDGEVIGLLSSTVENQSGIFALPIDAACKILRDHRDSGRVRQGWIGADIRSTAAPEHGSNARIRDVHKSSPGYTGGLRPGDVLLEVADWKITSPEDVLNASFYVTPGEPLELRISRAGKIRKLTITPTDSPTGESPTLQQEQPTFLGATEIPPAK